MPLLIEEISRQLLDRSRRFVLEVNVPVSNDDELKTIPLDNPELFDHSQATYEGRVAPIKAESEFLELAAYGPELMNPSDPVPNLSRIIIETLGGAPSGAPLPYSDTSMMPPTDCLAFYLPYAMSILGSPRERPVARSVRTV